LLGPEAFRAVFKTIAADNGSEFLDVEALECSVFGGSSRTCVYYAHPYSFWEWGTNENGNRMVRHFVPKGSDISKFTRKQIAASKNGLATISGSRQGLESQKNYSFSR
jgi:IS30 family transposase